MQSEPHFVVHERVPPRLDTRPILRGYAAVAIMVGLTIAGTGIRGIPGMSLPAASIVWIAGAVIFAAGCAAWGLAFNDDPVGRQRSIRWFAAGHLLVGSLVWTQWTQLADSAGALHGFPLPVAFTPGLIGFLLLAVTASGRLIGADGPDSKTALHSRSTYDQHIREIARREERARLARDLHDAVKQQLFVIQTAAATVQTRFDDDPDGAREALTQVRTAAREATTEMEALLDELQATPMESTGLVEALRKQCDALALRTGVEMTFTPGTMPPAGALRPGAHEAIYRVAQEALANVARHARAKHVNVSMNTTTREFALSIADDGAGIAPGVAGRGMGMANMRSRASEFGGSVTIDSGAPGTQVKLTLPLSNADLRSAWISAAFVALLAVSNLVFHRIRGGSADEHTSWWFLAFLALLPTARLATAYWNAARREEAQ